MGPGHVRRPRSALIAQLRIDYTDGTSQVVDTDDTWKSHFGPYAAPTTSTARRTTPAPAQPGWDQPAYDDAGWADAVVRELGHRPSWCPSRTSRSARPRSVRHWSRTEPTPRTRYIYDLGQNMVGVARMQLAGTAGQTVEDPLRARSSTPTARSTSPTCAPRR